MTVDVVTRECPQGVNEDVERYWSQRLPQIERLLQRIPANNRSLRLRVFCGDIGFTARAVLTLPTGTREIAEAQGRSPDEVRADIEAVRRALRQRLQEAGT